MPPKSQKLALAAVFLTISAFALPYATIPPLATTMADEMQFHWESFGYFFMVTYLACAVAGIVGGRLHTRFGITERTLVAVGVFALALIFAAGALGDVT